MGFMGRHGCCACLQVKNSSREALDAKKIDFSRFYGANFIVTMVLKVLSMRNKWISLRTKFLFSAQERNG